MNAPPTEEELIQAALAELDQLPEPDPTETDSLCYPEPAEEEASPTLAGLDASRRPQAKTACETCPNSVWFASPKELKCYCRVMFLVTWSTKEPSQITLCDGIYIGQE
jgi:hypothetical protein